MAAGEIKRFIDRFTLLGMLDTESKAYENAGLRYLRQSEGELLKKIEREPTLLRLPLIRADKRISMGQDEAGWKAMLD